MSPRLFVLFCLVGCIWADVYFPSSCSRCRPRDFIPKLPVATGPVNQGDNRPYAWAIEAMIQTKLNFRIVTPPSAGRICGIVGTCLYEAAKLENRDRPFHGIKKLGFARTFDDPFLTDAIDGAGLWALFRLFGDTPSFSLVFDHYEAFSGRSIRDLVPVMERAANTGKSSRGRKDLRTSPFGSDAIEDGVIACERVITEYTEDGYTPRGDLIGPIASQYEPKNSPQSLGGITHCDRMEVPGAWQPICVPNNANTYGTADCTPQTFVAHWAGRYTTYSLRKGTEKTGDLLVQPPPAKGSAEYRRQADQVLRISGKLGDREKVLAEYWADGPDSTMPAGHLWRIAADAAEYEGLSQSETAKLLFITGAALNDAGVASWRTKTTFDFNRPLQMIQCGPSHGKKRQAWLGPYKGTGSLNVSEWRPYQASTFVSPGFAGYTSGHSTFSAAGAEALKLYFGDDKYRGPNCDFVKEGESLYEPKSNAVPGVTDVPNKGPDTVGYTPAEDIIFCWHTWTKASLQSGFSRLWGGIHVKADDDNGQDLGRRIARSVYAKAKKSF